MNATDGDIGVVVSFLLDDKRWIVRYLVVETDGGLFDGRHDVLISPISFRHPEAASRRFHLALSRRPASSGSDGGLLAAS